MLQCRNCGNEQEEGKFCGNCGTSLENVKKQQAQSDDRSKIDGRKSIAETEFDRGQTVSKKTEQESASSETATISVTGEFQTESVNNLIEREQPKEQVATTQANQVQQAETTKTIEQRQFTDEPTKLSEQTETLSNHMQSYWSNVKDMLKNPAASFELDERHVHYGITSFILYALFFALTMNFLFRTLIDRIPYFSYIDIPYVQIFFQTAIMMIIYVAAVVVGTFLVDTLFLKRHAFKQLLAKLGSFIVPLLALQLVNTFIALAGAFKFTIFLLTVSLSFLIFIFPLLFIFRTAQHNDSDHKVYIAIGTFFVNGFFVYIVSKVVISTMFEALFDSFDGIIDFLLW